MQLHKQFLKGALAYSYLFNDGLLFYNNRFYISSNSTLKFVLLLKFLDTLLGRHTGIKLTLVRLSANFFQPCIRIHVEKYVSSCLICQQIKSSTQPLAGYIQPLPIPSSIILNYDLIFLSNFLAQRHYFIPNSSYLLQIDPVIKGYESGT